MPTYQEQMREVDRRRKIAQALQTQAMQPQGQQAGRFFVGPSTTSTVASLAAALGGAFAQRRADRDEKAARTGEQARLAQAFQRLTGGSDPGVDGAATPPDPRSQAAQEIIGGLPLEAQQQLLAGESIKRLFPEAKPGFKLRPGETQYDASGKPVVAQPAAAPGPTDDQREYDAAVKQGYKGTLEDWIMSGKRAGASAVNVNTEKNLYGAMADKQGQANVELYGQAQKAPDLLQRARRVKAMVGPGSQAITGAGADWLLTGAKVAAQLGFDTGDAAADTEALARDLAASTLDGIKASGLGAGSGFSNADRDFLEKVVGGTIRLEATTLARLADLNEKSALGTIQRWNATASRLQPDQLKTLGMAPIEMPAGSPAPSAAPKLQRNPDGSYTYNP